MGAADNGMEVQQSGDWDDWRQVGHCFYSSLYNLTLFVTNPDFRQLTLLLTCHGVSIIHQKYRFISVSL